MSRVRIRTALLCSTLLLIACPDDDPDPPPMGMDAAVGGADAIGDVDTGVTPPRIDAGPGVMVFRLRVENISGQTAVPTALSPILWTLHDAPDPLFTEGMPDRGQGLEALAEDGEADALDMALATPAHGVLNTPVGAAMPGPLLPGEVYEADLAVTMDAPKLSLATMVVESNDVFIGPEGPGIALIDGTGQPLAETDVTSLLHYWDVGTEVNQAPRSGPDQPLRQGAANTGAPEGVVREFDASTRALGLPASVLDVDVVPLGGGGLRLTLSNTSRSGGAMETGLSAIFWATHTSAWSLFTPGMAAPSEVEALAETGDPEPAVMRHGMMLGVGTATATPDKPDPDQSVQIELTPSADFPWLTIATGLNQTNDVFLAMGPSGVRLVGMDGQLRSTNDIEAEINRQLAFWDAGTEANEVPGAGRNQVQRQVGTSSGMPDPDPTVRKYADPTNDLATNAGGLVNVTIVNGANAGQFDITVENTSDQTAYTTAISPLVWALHDGNVGLYSPGDPPSAALAALAEDGNPSMLKAMVANLPNTMSAVQELPVGAPGVAPIQAGERYSWTVDASAAMPYFAIAAMVVGSNDTFLALGSTGIRLFDVNGMPQTDAVLATSVSQNLKAYDAGSEANQVGATGPDQPARQTANNTGASEGDGTVRKLDHPAWRYPSLSDLVRVTVTPR